MNKTKDKIMCKFYEKGYSLLETNTKIFNTWDKTSLILLKAFRKMQGK